MSAVEWGDPPPARAKREVFTPEIVAALQAAPGRWACIARDGDAPAAAMWAKHNPQFEATSRMQPADVRTWRRDIWARYVGDPEQVAS